MFKFVAILLVVAVTVSAKPGILAPIAYNAQYVAAAPAVVTATSSQVVARNYNGLAAAQLVAAPVAYSAPAVAYSAPIAYSAYSAYNTAPVAAYSAYSAYSAAPVAYAGYGAAPLKYTALL